jgi:hypothetical protein
MPTGCTHKNNTTVYFEMMYLIKETWMSDLKEIILMDGEQILHKMEGDA